jgi:hypothetical protein
MGIFFNNTSFICCHSDSAVSENAGIEPRTEATSALVVRRSNHSARSHPPGARPTTLLLDLIHLWLDLCSTSSRSHTVHMGLDLIHKEQGARSHTPGARSHPPGARSHPLRLDLIHLWLDLIQLQPDLIYT